MNRKTARRLLASIALACWISLTASLASALPRTWIGGDGNWDDGGSTTLWSPADEPDSDDEAIFGAANTVSLGTVNSIQGLTLSGGISLSANSFNLDVGGPVHLAGSSTLSLSGGTSLVSAQNIIVDSGGIIHVAGGQVTVGKPIEFGVFDINAGGSLVGNGTINLTDSVGTLTTLIINGGMISAHSDPVAFVPPEGTLLVNATSPNARIDLDGTAGGVGVINVFRNQTLDINANVTDAFGGTMNLFHNSTLDISKPWTLDVGSINVDNGLVPESLPMPAIPADIAYISGGTLTQTGGTISIPDSDGALQFNAGFIQRGGTLNTNGRVIINSKSQLDAGATVTGTGSLIIADGGNLVIAGGLTIDMPVRNEGGFDPTGPTSVGEVTVDAFTQTATGTLYLQLGGYAPKDVDRLLIDGAAGFDGSLHVRRLNSLALKPGDSFTTITYLSHTGTFNISNQTGIAGLTFVGDYGATSLTLTAAALFAGDADLNGRVDVLDLVALANHWLSNGTWVDGDFDGNGFVDQHDLGLLAIHWQAGANAPALSEAAAELGLPASSVPEPSALVLSLFGLFGLPRRRHR